MFLIIHGCSHRNRHGLELKTKKTLFKIVFITTCISKFKRFVLKINHQHCLVFREVGAVATAYISSLSWLIITDFRFTHAISRVSRNF